MRTLVLAVFVVGAVLALAPSTFASGPSALGRTGWQVDRPYGPVYTAHYSDHGDPGFYNYIPGPIPAGDASGWSDCGPGNGLCPSADTIGMNMPYGSRLYGYPCLSSADFTFFQSLVSIPAGTSISQFSVSMSGADDGARVSIYNSSYPSGLILPGSYIQLVGGTGSTSDLSPYMVAGEVNRVVITQMDDCATGNNLQFAQILLNGTVVPPKPPDTAPPTDAPVVTPAANGAGWNNSDVNVAWNWTDGDSGIDASNCTQSSVSLGEGLITLTSSCKDNAGNSASDSRTVKVDKTAPAAAPTFNAGWSNSDVTVNWNWTDGGSGIDTSSCTQSSTSSGEGSITLSSTCQDLAGNSASDSVTVHVDKTAPTGNPVASPPANGAGWNNSDVSVAWNWTDGGSGIDSSSCTQSSTSSGEGSITLTSTCQDVAGNSASASVSVKVDKTAPTVTYTGAGTYSVDQNVSIGCSASDALSGVASSTCAGVSGPAWSFGLGTHSVSATATDNAGNSGSGSATFTVTVDANSLCGLVKQFAKNAGIANSLCVKLQNAAAAGARGDLKAKSNILDAFDNEVRAQSGKGFTAAQAALLIQLATSI